jgi:exodeoxyribonuclease VII large subunit
VEDLLPFSDEGLLRAVAKARTPVVSAIGHEKDSPLLDLVADVRASTPTDAARRVVPDMAEQLALINELRSRSANAVRVKLDRATASLDAIRARPALADPFTLLDGPTQTVAALRDRARRSLVHQLDRAEDDIAHRRAQVRALSPAATLERGYAIVRTADGHVVTDPDQAKTGEPLRVNVSTGEFTATRVDPMVVP